MTFARQSPFSSPRSPVLGWAWGLLAAAAVVAPTWAADKARSGFPQAKACEVRLLPVPLPTRQTHDSAIEVEIDATDKVMALFTTHDGTVKPVWPQGEPLRQHLPAEVYARLRALAPNRHPLTARWEELSAEEQRQILMAAARAKVTDFFLDRRVPGLRYKKKIWIEFPKMMRLAGFTYPRGLVEVETKYIFNGTKIEYMGAKRRGKNLGFELHVRSALNVGENFVTARALARLLAGDAGNVHVHITGPYPSSLNAVEALRLSGFLLRARMAFDFLMIERGIPLADISSGDAIGQGFFRDDRRFMTSFVHWINGARKTSDFPRFFSKDGSMGMRSHHFYDKHVWGIEGRYLPASIDDERLSWLLDRLQTEMIDRTYMTDEREIFDYLIYRGWDGYSVKWLTRMFNSEMVSFEHIFGLRDIRASALYVAFTPRERAAFDSALEQNELVKYLLMDWRTMLLTWNNPGLQAQVAAAQTEAVQWLVHGRSTTEVMERFARKSGLRHRLGKDLPGVFD